MNMRIAIAAFTQQGLDLAAYIAQKLQQEGEKTELATTCKLASTCNEAHIMESLQSWTASAFKQADALVFVCACGIAVRAIAPHVQDKFSDPAVISIDEHGNFVIPLLSGHVGGANRLARRIASITGAQAAISTATDVNGLFSVDEWAVQNKLIIGERQLAKEVSAALLAGQTVGFASDLPWKGNLPHGLLGCSKIAQMPHSVNAADGSDESIVENESLCSAAACDTPDLGIYVGSQARCPFVHTLHLIPQNLVIGAGCRRNTAFDKVESLFETLMGEGNFDSRSVSVLASINLKCDEACLHTAAKKYGWKLCFYSTEQLLQAPGDFEESEFVAQTVGVGNVCERSAVFAAEELKRTMEEQGQDPVEVRVLAHKRKGQDCTAAIAQVLFTLKF